ncbi:MAG: Metalloenzyme, LuxS/M16 peptidase-like protein, partial [Olpidium bornovanus]
MACYLAAARRAAPPALRSGAPHRRSSRAKAGERRRLLRPHGGGLAPVVAFLRRARAEGGAASPDTRSSALITVIDNGVTVATESNPASPLATVGAWFFAGSRAETPASPGAAHVLERLALKVSPGPSSFPLGPRLEAFGGRLRSYTSREHNAFYAEVLKKDVGKALEIIASGVQNPCLDKAAVEAAKAESIAARKTADNCPETITFDHLYATAFQGEATSPPLTFSRPVIAVEDNIRALVPRDIAAFHLENISSNRLVIAGAGNVDHEEL